MPLPCWEAARSPVTAAPEPIAPSATEEQQDLKGFLQPAPSTEEHDGPQPPHPGACWGPKQVPQESA